MDYPFVKCLHPVKMRNPHTQEKITVACGRCEACLNRRAGINSFRIRCEASVHKYCMFITLTYDDKYVPRFDIRLNDNGLIEAYVVGGLSDGEILDTELSFSDCRPENIELYRLALYNKAARLPDEGFTYCRTRDLQLFLKRIRKFIFNRTYEKVRFYGISEYGPVHYRAHFHVLLFFDQDDTLSLFSDKDKCPCWEYGRSSAELATGDAASYVSTYLSSACSLPEILKVRSTRPKSYHSNYLGEKVFEGQFTEVYADASYRALSASVPIGEGIVEVNAWRSYFCRLFPRCIRFASLSFAEKLRVYRIISEARLYVSGVDSVCELAEKTVGDLLYGITSDLKESPAKDFFSYISSLIDFPSRYTGCGQMDDDMYDRLVSRCYRIFLCSRLFFRICDRIYDDERLMAVFGLKDLYLKSSDYEFSSCVLKVVEKFYSSYELSKLENFYKSQQVLFDDKLMSLFYDNCNDGFWRQRLAEFQPFKQFSKDSFDSYYKSVKHKTLNDLNNIFNSNLKKVYG